MNMNHDANRDHTTLVGIRKLGQAGLTSAVQGPMRPYTYHNRVLLLNSSGSPMGTLAKNFEKKQ
jgi:hypothetical protein